MPDLTGTWQPTGETAAIRLGRTTGGYPSAKEPIVGMKPRPVVVFNMQKDRTVAGYVSLPQGQKQTIVGAFRRNGELLISTEDFVATAQMYGDELEICWQDNVTGVAVVACDIMRKSDAKK